MAAKKKPVDMASQFPVKTVFETNGRIIRAGAKSHYEYIIEVHTLKASSSYRDDNAKDKWEAETFELCLGDLQHIYPQMELIHQAYEGNNGGDGS